MVDAIMAHTHQPQLVPVQATFRLDGECLCAAVFVIQQGLSFVSMAVMYEVAFAFKLCCVHYEFIDSFIFFQLCYML